MRLNKFLAHSSGLSRRAADQAIEDGKVTVNGQPARIGMSIEEGDEVLLDGTRLHLTSYSYVLLNKPVGYLSSKKAQSAPTLYELLPEEYQKLKTVGRLDKDTSGVILLTDDGDYANELTHPKYQKEKRYKVRLNKFLTEKGMAIINNGVELEDGVSHLQIEMGDDGWYTILMREGKNRQIRRTFEAIDYEVTELHRTDFGPYSEVDLAGSMYAAVEKKEI